MVFRYSSFNAKMRLALSLFNFELETSNKSANPFFENSSNITSIPKSACVEEIFLVFKNPFIYAVAGYGVFSWVNGGVMAKMSVFKRFVFLQK